VLWIALAIAASIAAGVEAERRAGARAGVWARTILKLLLYVVMPLVAFFNIARLEVNADVGAGIVIGSAALLLTALIGWIAGRRLIGLTRPSAGVLAIVGL
jgi:predicted permease